MWKKLNETGRDQETIMSVFAKCFITSAKYSFMEGGLHTRLFLETI